MIEELLKELTAEVKGLKQAIVALRSEGLTSTSTPDTAETDDLDDPEVPAKKVAAKKTAAKTAAKTAPTKSVEDLREDLRNHVRDERDRLKADVSAEAAAEHKAQTAIILKKFKAESITKIADKDVEAVFAAIKAIDAGASVEAESDDDDL